MEKPRWGSKWGGAFEVRDWLRCCAAADWPVALGSLD